MKIIEIIARDNGAHRNQEGEFANIPEGWAVIPDDMETPNFPFGEIEAAETDGVMTVTKWVAGKAPKPPKEFEEETASNKTVWDIMAEAYSEGVNEA